MSKNKQQKCNTKNLSAQVRNHIACLHIRYRSNKTINMCVKFAIECYWNVQLISTFGVYCLVTNRQEHSLQWTNILKSRVHNSDFFDGDINTIWFFRIFLKIHQTKRRLIIRIQITNPRPKRLLCPVWILP